MTTGTCPDQVESPIFRGFWFSENLNRIIFYSLLKYVHEIRLSPFVLNVCYMASLLNIRLMINGDDIECLNWPFQYYQWDLF